MRKSPLSADPVRANAPVRILMVVPQYPYPVVGGLEKQAHELATELVLKGIAVHVLSGRIYAEQADREIVDGVVVHRLPWSRRRWLRWLTMPWLVWRAFGQRMPEIDVVHCHVFSGFGLASILLAHAFGKPILVKLPNVGADGVPGLRAQAFGFVREWIFRQADAVVAMSSESVRELTAIGFDLRRILTTPNGIAIPLRHLRAAPVAEQPVRLVFVGRLSAEKGVADLIAALSRVAQFQSGTIRWTLDLIGDGPLRSELQTRAVAAGIASQIRFRGHVHEVQRALLDYDALLLPSYREGNSNAILEAMAAGMPVVSTRVGGTPMLLGAEGAELLYEAADVDALTVLLMRVIGDPGLRHRVGTALRARTEAYFDIRRVAETYAAAYRLLAAGRRTEIHAISNPIVPRNETVPCAV